jgi:flagellar capping protein FliD
VGVFFPAIGSVMALAVKANDSEKFQQAVKDGSKTLGDLFDKHVNGNDITKNNITKSNIKEIGFGLADGENRRREINQSVVATLSKRIDSLNVAGRGPMKTAAATLDGKPTNKVQQIADIKANMSKNNSEEPKQQTNKRNTQTDKDM